MFKIGHSYGEPENMTRQLNGEICEVRIWNVIRSQEEIYKNMYDVDPQTTGLKAYWKFNELLYAAFGGEADLAGFAAEAARRGKVLAYPVCGENCSLTAAVPGPDGWETGLYGIRTPVLERSVLLEPEQQIGRASCRERV